MDSTNDTAGVIAPPPVLYVGTLAVALFANWLLPLPISPDAIARWPGVAIALLGLALATGGGVPWSPPRPTSIPTSRRRPSSRRARSALIPLLVVMHFGVVCREERYLDAKFGESYRAYRRRVRRYL